MVIGGTVAIYGFSWNYRQNTMRERIQLNWAQLRVQQLEEENMLLKDRLKIQSLRKFPNGSTPESALKAAAMDSVGEMYHG